MGVAATTCFFESMHLGFFLNFQSLTEKKTFYILEHVNWRNHLLYFLIPAGLHVIINSYLFVITAIRCSRVKSEIHRMQRMSDDSTTTAKRRNFIIAKAMFV